MTKKLPRRTFLRGAAGGVAASIGLPLLDPMVPTRARAAGGFPNRYLVSFGGVAMGHRLGSPPAPTGPLTSSLGSPFASLRDLIDDVTLVSGLDIEKVNDDALVPPGGAANVNHGKQLSPMLTGIRSQKSIHDTFRGPTSDQIVADAIGAGTLMPRGYQFLIQPVGYQYGSRGRDALSARSPGQGTTGVSNPLVAFNDLFGSGAPTGSTTGGTTPSGPSQQLLRDRSVLDVVLGSTNRLMARLGAEDRRRIDQHLTEIRALERRIEELIARAGGSGSTTPPPSTSSCTAPARPGTIGPTTTFTSSGGQLVGWSDEDLRADIYAEMAALAFACDLTRSATWHISWEQCGISAREITGNDKAFHQIGHDGPNTEVVPLTAWHVDQFAKLVRALKSKPEGSGTVLDSTFCCLFFGESPSSHGMRDMTATIAGCGGSLRMGEHVRAAGAHPAQVLITGMQAVGVDTDELGEVRGALGALQR